MEFKVSKDDGESADQMAEINIVPLVDVMLVLLIIFMVAAPLSIGGIPIKLPTSKARGSDVKEDRVILSINRDGFYFVEKVPIPGDNLESRLKSIFEHRKHKDLYIRADEAVKYGKVVSAMSAAKIAGVSKINMLTESKQVVR